MSRDWPIVFGGVRRPNTIRPLSYPGRNGPIILHELKQPVIRPANSAKRLSSTIFDGLLLLFELTAIGVILVVAYLAATLPDPAALDASLATAEPVAAVMSDSDPVPLRDVPNTLFNSVARVEGKGFFAPMRFDLLQLVQVLSGATKMAHLNATVAERLAATLLPDPPLSDADLIRQWMLALRIEARYSRDELVEIYFNRISFGGGTVGVDAAAHLYFGRNVQALSRNQALELAVRVDLPSRGGDPGEGHQPSRPTR
jgi:membrane peptidoglycan carboxypeptidase